MKKQHQVSTIDEAKFAALFREECRRKESLLDEAEKMEKRERLRKNVRTGFQRKYERVRKGLFFVDKKAGDFVHLSTERGEEFGVLHVSPEVSHLLRLRDGLEGVFGFRDGYWRVQFLFCVESSAENFIDETENS